MSGEPWSSFELDDERVVSLTDQSAVVAYRASAARGDLSYSALISSTYVRGAGKWRLALHQQTPTCRRGARRPCIVLCLQSTTVRIAVPTHDKPKRTRAQLQTNAGQPPHPTVRGP